jgi:uncharacterized protein (UPF0332 family)
VKEEIKAVLAQAEEKLRVARLLLDGHAWGDASSRAYYAAFHAVSALLLSRGETYSSHAQVIGRFNKEFVHSGLFPAEFTTVLTRLYEDRQSGDYDFVAGVSEAEARQDVLDAQRIVEAIQRFLSSP